MESNIIGVYTLNANELTIRYAQKHQPWTVPYSKGVIEACKDNVKHILATHNVLHAAKTVGKLAAIFEDLDHGVDVPDMKTKIADMTADLLTEALRMANFFDFDLATVLAERIKEKNGVDILEIKE